MGVVVVVTKRVREEVQRHFGCDKLTGAELEDQGEEGTALTHWEKRLFEVEGKNILSIFIIPMFYRCISFCNQFMQSFVSLERGNDRNSHTKSNLLKNNYGVDGRYRMVHAKL